MVEFIALHSLRTVNSVLLPCGSMNPFRRSILTDASNSIVRERQCSRKRAAVISTRTGARLETAARNQATAKWTVRRNRHPIGNRVCRRRQAAVLRITNTQTQYVIYIPSEKETTASDPTNCRHAYHKYHTRRRATYAYRRKRDDTLQVLNEA
jgi:hypothetical protein